MVAGKAPPSIRAWTPSEWFAYSLKAYARSLFLPAFITARELPPFSELTSPPFSYCGSAAARQSPEADSTPETKFAGIQAPVESVAIVPSARPLYHSSLQFSIGARSFSSRSFCQTLVKAVTPLSAVRSTVTSVSRVLKGYHRPARSCWW